MKKMKVGLVILFIYLILALASFKIVPAEDIKNWNYKTYWLKNPRMAPPEWVNIFGKNLPPTGNLKEEKPGEYVYNFHYDQPPQDILIIPPENWSGFVDITVLRPDGKSITLYSGKITGMASTGKSFFVLSDLARQIGINEGISDLVVKGEGLRILFFRKNGDQWIPIHGDYTFIVNSSSKITLRVVGKTCGVLGTDSDGRDILVIFLGGLPQTLLIVFITALTTVILGTVTGLLGALSGKLGILIDGFAKVSSMLPMVPTMILLAPLLGEINYYGTLQIPISILVFALSLLLFGKVAQNVRTITMTELSKEHILASRALGGSELWILGKHVLKAVLPYAISQLILMAAKTIAIISILGFFNVYFGFNWGELLTMVVTQRAIYSGAWWMVVPVGVAITGIAVALLLIKSEIEEKLINPWESL